MSNQDTFSLGLKSGVILFRFLVLPCVMLGLWLQPGALAATWTVDDLSDYPWVSPGSLRYALWYALPGDTIVISAAGTINLNGYDLPIGQDLTIAGPGADLLAISGQGASRVFTINSSATVSISGLTICNGKAHTPSPTQNGTPGGGIYNEGTLALNSCVISNNAAGDLYGYPGQTGNWPGGAGGGVYNAGTMTASNCVFVGNISGRVYGAVGAGGDGGGICNTGTMNLVLCAIINNGTSPGSSGGWGGGIMNLGSAVLNACAIYGNYTGVGGSNFNTSVAYGGSGGSGGGICSAYGVGGMSATNCTIANNVTGNGGEALTDWGAWGGGGGWGGGLYTGTNCVLVNCTITGNATGKGGDARAPSWIDYAFAHGGDGGNGGGLASEAGCILIACTIARNIGGEGGHPYGGTVGHATTGNRGQSGVYGRVRLWNSLVANTNAYAAQNRDVDGGVTSLGYNLIGITNAPNVFTNQDLCGSTSAPLDPGLAPLADNGGCTATCALLSGSPAIDHGDDSLLDAPWSLATDQRGLPRRSGSQLDVGAFEVQWALSPLLVRSCVRLADGSMQLSATNLSRASLTLLATTNLSVPISEWSVLGPMPEITPGYFQFCDPPVSNSIQRFFRLRSP